MRWTDFLDLMRTPVLSVAALAFALPAPALAAKEPSTRLVPCGDESCLLITGHRTDAASTVYINGREVEVKGARKWRTRVPMKTVREWSSPFARTINVSVADASVDADLPIGLFAHIEDLAMLTITAK